MTRAPQRAARRLARTLAVALGDEVGPTDLARRLRALRARQRRMATRLQQRLDLLAAESRARHDELAAQVASAQLPHDSQAELVGRIWLHEAWLRAMPPSGVLLSVVVPTRHRPDLLRRALTSLLAQTHREWEGIVVDDGDLDRSGEVRGVLEELADPRLRLVPAHAGNEAAARNAGLDAASGQLVTYLDDDNVMFPVWLAALADAAHTHPDAPLLYGARVTREAGGEERVHLGDFDREALEQHNSIDTGQIGHRADPRVRWDTALVRFTDWDLVLRLTEDRDGVPVPALAVGYTTDAPDRISERADLEASAAPIRARARSRTADPPGQPA